MTIPPVVAEAVAELPPVVAKAVVTVKSGRRRSDWQVFKSQSKHALFWTFGMFLDETQKPSMSRINFALWTILGWRMVAHEMRLKPGDVSLSNTCWTAWWAAEGMIAVAVFGPRIASYFGAGAAGAVTGMGSSIRDAVTTIEAHMPGHDG